MQDKQEKLMQVLTETIEYLKQQNGQHQEQINQQDQQIVALIQKIISLRQTIDYLRHKIYGASSEKTDCLKEKPKAIDVSNETEANADPSLKEPDAEDLVSEYVRKQRGKYKTRRSELLKQLPIEKILCRNSAENHICEQCESELVPFTEKFVHEEIQIIPAKIRKIHYYQEVLLCPVFPKEHDEFVTVAAEPPSPLIPHSPASPSTVAYIMYQKYANAMPCTVRKRTGCRWVLGSAGQPWQTGSTNVHWIT